MLGHKLAQVLTREAETIVAVRGDATCWPKDLRAAEIVEGVDVRDTSGLARLLDSRRPDVVLNAVGVVKQILGEHDPLDTITINGLFPNLLGLLCEMRGIRLVHYSTDCVFMGTPEGTRGPDGYREVDPADSRDLYGMSKLAGEPKAATALVLRTSIIGRELRGFTSLIEWFLAQGPGSVKGFTKALFTGLTTLELAQLTAMVLRDFPEMTGLWHVAAPPITKHDLLMLVKASYGRRTEIVPQDDFYCDRRLDGSRFRAATGWRPAAWPDMIETMRKDPFDYEALRLAPVRGKAG
jgi:dTDP-4-dehydrorhamnose reductase